jgi:hypothetical protein
MLVDLDRIRFYEWDSHELAGPIFETESAPVFRFYSDSYDDFLNREMRERYLTTLVEVWLRDLAYHWKSETPPGSESLTTTGLFPLLDEMKF